MHNSCKKSDFISENKSSTVDKNSGSGMRVPKILEHSVYEGLRDTLGETFSDLLGIYVQEAEGLILRIETARQAGDMAAIGFSAHSLKSSSANIGAMRLSFLAWQIEKYSKEAVELPEQKVSETTVDKDATKIETTKKEFLDLSWSQSWDNPSDFLLHRGIDGLISSLREVFSQTVYMISQDISVKL